MTTQHNMPPMPKTWQERQREHLDRRCEVHYEADYMQAEINDLRAHAAALAEKVRELEAEVLTLHVKLAHETLRADQGWQRYESANADRNSLRALAARQPVEAEPAAIIAAVDAAMVEMRNIVPPLRRSECERLIRAALAAEHPATVDRDAAEAALQAIEDNDLPGAAAILKTLRTATPPAAEGVEGLNQAKEAIEWLCLHLERDHRCLHMSPSASGIPAWINKAVQGLDAAITKASKKGEENG